MPQPGRGFANLSSKNQRIVFLKPDEVEAQLAALKPIPSLYVAAAIMIYAGLRRAEVLWLHRDAIAKGLSFRYLQIRERDEAAVRAHLATLPLAPWLSFEIVEVQ